VNPSSTQQLGAWHLRHYPVLESTNQHAKQLVMTTAFSRSQFDHMVIMADQQTAGRGQYQRSWQSPLGGLYMTAVMADIPTRLRGVLALLVGCAVAQALDQLAAPSIQIRWPNDLTFLQRKVGGILCEGIALGTDWITLIGIGINVNQPLEALDGQLQTRATTLRHIDGKVRNVTHVAGAILQRLDELIDETQRDPNMLREYLQQRDALLGRKIVVQTPSQTWAGTASGIAMDGALLLNGAQGVQAIHVGSVVEIEGLGRVK